MEMAIKKFRLKGTSPILGSIALKKETYEKFLATKGKTEEELKRALESVDCVIEPEDDDNKFTGFYRDPETGNVILQGYQIKGFLKEAAKALKDQLGLVSYVSKIDNLVFIDEKNIPVMRNGEWLKEPDGFLERPLRASTAQGPRVTLAKSESIEPEWYLDITVKVLENKKTTKSVEMSMGIVEELLSYGELKGLLQWRNGGYGSFTCEEIE